MADLPAGKDREFDINAVLFPVGVTAWFVISLRARVRSDAGFTGIVPPKQHIDMKTILHIATENLMKMRRKYIIFKPEKHAVVMGNLTDKKTGKIIGKILRVSSE
jgi:hypothetical protein